MPFGMRLKHRESASFFFRGLLVLMPLALALPVLRAQAVDIGPAWFLIDAGGQTTNKSVIPFKNFKPISDKTFVFRRAAGY